MIYVPIVIAWMGVKFGIGIASLSRSMIDFLSRNWAGSKWRPVLKIWEQLRKTLTDENS